VFEGEVYLVVVDNRLESPNYNKWESYIISDRNHISVLVPPGFVNAHLCLSDECLFHYTQSYPKEYVDWFDQEEVKWNDSQIGIEWPIDNPILSWRDK
jgi:dTDP-4-dehydrorhamnose 3,5-epimerase